MLKHIMLHTSIFAVITILSLSPIATGAAGEKDTLIIGLQDDTVSFDPVTSVETVPTSIMLYIYEKLVTYENFDYTQPMPGLAESWELGEDGKTWTFHLRKSVTFVSGNPVRADDVVFSLRRFLKIGYDPIVFEQFGITQEAIMKIDDETIRISLDQQYAPGLFLSVLAGTRGAILDQKTLMKHEKDGDMGSAWLNTHSAGSGPYVIEERVPGERLVLTANPHYWKGKPVFEKIIVRHIPEPVTQMALLEKGEIDVAWDLSPDQLKRLKNERDVRIAGTQTFKLLYVALNLAYEPLSKPEVRDAIRYAIDYDGLVKYILLGAAQKIQTVIPKGIFGYNPALPYHRDLERAKHLLKDAGSIDGFELELACVDSSPWIDMSTKVKNDLAEIGIRVKLTPMPAPQLVEAMFSHKIQSFLWSWEIDYADPDASIKPFAVYDANLLAWWCNYNNPELAKLAEQATQELDPEKRAALYKQLTDIVLDNGPYALFASPIKQIAVRAEVELLVGPPPPILSSFPTLK